MKKILILANNDVGLYKFRKELIQELLAQGNQVVISLPYGELVNPLIEMGCEFYDTPVDRRGVNPVTDFQLLVGYIKLVKKIKPDMVLTYTVKPNVYGGLACIRNKASYAVNITGLGTAFQGDGMLKKLIVKLYQFALKRAKVIFFENIENKQIFIENSIVTEGKTCCLNGAGVNLGEYPLCPYPSDDTIHFLFIGRVMKEKGVDELFEVAKQIKSRYETVVFDIVGPFEDDYKEIVEQLQADHIIVYHGFQTDVKPFIQQAHCFVLPSYHEGMANTLLECGAMGRPLITSNIHGCKEAVIVNESGYLCEPQSIEGLYEKIVTFIELATNEKAVMGEKSREHIEAVFDKRRVVEETVRGLGV